MRTFDNEPYSEKHAYSESQKNCGKIVVDNGLNLMVHAEVSASPMMVERGCSLMAVGKVLLLEA